MWLKYLSVLWAVLIARIYEVFPLLCPMCGGQMRLIAFITEGTQIRKILDHIGQDSKPPHTSPAYGSPLWADCDAHAGACAGRTGQPTGMGQHNRDPTLRSISASTGDRAKR
jgi:hypothetical protein